MAAWSEVVEAGGACETDVSDVGIVVAGGPGDASCKVLQSRH